MNFKKCLPSLILSSIFGAGWIYCHIREQKVRNELDKAWTAIYDDDKEYFDTFHHPEK